MSSEYFKNFPEISYTLDNRVIKIKDFFRKSRVDESSLDQIIDYTFYECEDGDRPDVVASKLYGDSELHWTFFLCNDISNYYDWYKGASLFENYIFGKYTGKILMTTNTSDLINATSKILLGETVTSTGVSGNVKLMQPTFRRVIVDNLSGDFAQGQTVTGKISNHVFTISEVREHRDGVSYYTDGKTKSTVYTNGWQEVTLYEEEYEKNEERRFIKVIKPNRIRSILKEFEKIMKS